MFKNLVNEKLFMCENDLFNELSSLESILKLTKESCYEQELNGNYYCSIKSNRIKLSEERNHYLNLLTIALEKINTLKAINLNLEKELCSLK